MQNKRAVGVAVCALMAAAVVIGCQEQNLANPTERNIMPEQTNSAVGGAKQLPVDNPMGIRIVRFPAGRMVTSGPGTFWTDNFRQFEKFLGRQPADMTPRDLLSKDPATGQFVWGYMLPSGTDEASLDTEGLAVVDFPGGLYAAGIARNNDFPDMERVTNAMIAWATQAGYKVTGFRCTHMVAPNDTKALLGYQQLELFIPIAAE